MYFVAPYTCISLAGGTLLGGSLGRVSSLLTQGRQNRRLSCYVALTVIVLFIVLYWLLSHR